MKQIEQKVQERTASDGVNRRIALAALTQSTSQMVDGLRDDPDAQEAMDQALGCLASTTDFLKAQLEIFEAAQMRIAGAMLVVTNDEAQP